MSTAQLLVDISELVSQTALKLALLTNLLLYEMVNVLFKQKERKMLKSSILVRVTFLEMGYLQTQVVEMRSYQMRVCPKSRMTGVLIRRGETQRCRQTQKEDDCGKTQAEIRVMHLEAREHQGLSAISRSSEKARMDSSLEPSEPGPAKHHDFRLLASKTVKE